MLNQTWWAICWKNPSKLEAFAYWRCVTWEGTELLHNQFPTVDLKNNDLLWGGSIDRPRRSMRVLKKNPQFLALVWSSPSKEIKLEFDQVQIKRILLLFLHLFWIFAAHLDLLHLISLSFGYNSICLSIGNE